MKTCAGNVHRARFSPLPNAYTFKSSVSPLQDVHCRSIKCTSAPRSIHLNADHSKSCLFSTASSRFASLLFGNGDRQDPRRDERKDP